MTEFVNPIDRFSFLKVDDHDMDGYVNLTPLPPQEIRNYLQGEVLQAPLTSEWLASLGVTQTTIHEDIETMMSALNVSQERQATIRTALAVNDYPAAANGLTGTGADITFYCNGRRHDWVVGFPLVASCGTITGTPRVLFHAQPVSLATLGVNVNDLQIELTAVKIDPTFDIDMWGAAYERHAILVPASTGGVLTASLQLRGLTTDNVEIDIRIGTPAGVYQTELPFIYSFGSELFWGKTIYIDLAENISEYSLHLSVDLSGGFAGSVHLLNRDATAAIRAVLRFWDGANAPYVSLSAHGFPEKFKIGYHKGGSFSPQHLITLENGAGDYSMPDLEIKASYYNSGPQITLQFVGFPAKNTLRLAETTYGCDGDSIFSADLSKRATGTEGRYRAILVTGHACDKVLTATGSNLHRARIAFAKRDRWDSDGEPMFMLGATTHVGSDSYLNVDTDLPWRPDFSARIRYQSPTQAWWGDTLGVTWRSGYVPVGKYLEDDGFFINAYFWAIGENQLSQDICVFRFEEECV